MADNDTEGPMRNLFLLAALTLTACDSQPPPKTVAEINQFVSIADTAIGLVQKTSAGASTADLQAATQEMYVALDVARSQIDAILGEVTVGKYLGRGSIDPIHLSACIGANTAGMHFLEIESTRPAGVMNIVQCAVQAKIYFQSLSGDDGAAAALAIGVIYPIALVANAKAGMMPGPWLREYRSTNDAIVARLAPKCRERTGVTAAGSEQVRYRCAAYEVAMSVQPKLAALANQVAMPPGSEK
jgi:hypothetical protein